MKPPSKSELVKHRILRSKETLGEVADLIDLEYYHTAVNRIYYACFYATTALLLKNNIRAHTHSGVKRMISLHFVKTKKITSLMGDFYSDLFDKRHTGDYDDFIEFDKQTVNELHQSAVEFIRAIEKLL